MQKAIFSTLLILLGWHTIHAQQGLGKGLIARYLFNGDSRDASGNGNHGVNHNVTDGEDRFGCACGASFFNGSDSYITVPDSRSLSTPTTQLTIGLWVKLIENTPWSDLRWMTICCKSDQAGEAPNNPQFRLQATTVTVSMNTHFTENVQVVLEYNSWYYYTLTYDGQVVRVYVDGTEYWNFPWQTTFEPNNFDMEIGRDMPGVEEYYAGYMDDLRIYNRALSASEVLALATDESERTSPKPCGQVVPPPTPGPGPIRPKPQPIPDPVPDPTPVPQPIPKPKPIPVPQPVPPKPDPAPISPPVTTGGNDTILVKDTVYVKSADIKMYLYDHDKEDGDTVSILWNGAWVVENLGIKLKKNGIKILNFHLTKNQPNYLISRALNLGTVVPNTLTIEIIDPKSPKPFMIKLDSNIGTSKAFCIIYKSD